MKSLGNATSGAFSPGMNNMLKLEVVDSESVCKWFFKMNNY